MLAFHQGPAYGTIAPYRNEAPTFRTIKQSLREYDWKIAIVTNGTTTQQTLKIQKVGLEPYVDTVVISEAERIKKPNPEIFRIAAHRLGEELTGGWMVGGHCTRDSQHFCSLGRTKQLMLARLSCEPSAYGLTPSV